MSRCRSCDVVLTEVELKRRDPLDGSYLDLCANCAKVSTQVVDGTFIEPPEYAHGFPGLEDIIETL